MSLFDRVKQYLNTRKYILDKRKNETTVVLSSDQFRAINALMARGKIEPDYISVVRDKRIENVRRVSFIVIEGETMFQSSEISIWSDGKCPILDIMGKDNNETTH